MKNLSLLCLALFVVGCAPGEAGVRQNNEVNNVNNTDRCTCRDADGDGICDFDEGKAELRDSDGDGTPDFEDLDSDGDSIPDAQEAGDADTCTPPVDSDADGQFDFIDNDSDGNGISDGDEGVVDTDGDGFADYVDPDNDNDYMRDDYELGGCDSWEQDGIPCDTDGDGTPDYMTPDSDGDGIGDRWETTDDADDDGVPNFRDDDSDGDGIPDALEGCTGGDPAVQPCDSDGDSFYDFLDVDSDNDGLLDGTEDANHNGVRDGDETDPRDADSDDDGVNDMIESAAGTDPLDGTDSPRTRGDFVFLVPFEEDPDPPNDVLAFSTAFQRLDLMFVMDVSGSMAAELNAVRDGLNTMLADIICAPGQNPSIDQCIPDVQSGIVLFGQSGTPTTLTKPIDGNNLPADPGADNQCTYNLLPTVATGGAEQTVQGQVRGVRGTCASDPSRIGEGCFRPGALHLILLVTDEDLKEDTTYSARQTAWDDIFNAGGRIIVDYGAGGTTEINSLLTDMNAASSGGVPLVPVVSPTAYASIASCQSLGANPFYLSGSDYRAMVRGDDATAGAALSCAVQAVGAYMPQDVEALIFNDPANADALGNPVDAPSAFIDYIEVHMVDQDATCPAGYNTADGDSDGHNDRFVQILPGNPVCWRIHVKQNLVVEPVETPQMFKATVEVYGTGGALLDSREVFFLVPPEFEGPGGPA
ncbi:hypothetical protein KJ975_08430 [Myxococcota bacterium]|nr:hypothetical protein [Myxococcota bacterium]